MTRPAEFWTPILYVYIYLLFLCQKIELPVNIAGLFQALFCTSYSKRKIMKSRKAYAVKNIAEKIAQWVTPFLCSSVLLPAASESDATNCRFIVEICHCEIVSTRSN